MATKVRRHLGKYHIGVGHSAQQMKDENAQKSSTQISPNYFSVATPAESRGETFFVLILGGEKLLEKSAGEII